MSTSDTPRPLMTFPCENYPIKVLGSACADFEQQVLLTVKAHAEVCGQPAPLNASRNGRFTSMTINIIATGEPQLKRMHEALKALVFVKMVL